MNNKTRGIFLINKNVPQVSIIVPVLNGEKFIGKCLESIIRLNYPKDNFEIIIVDNGSTDKTVEIIKEFQNNNRDNINIKLFFEKIKSSYAARNLGIKNAKGEIVAFTDVDCVVDKYWLINIVKPFSDNAIGGVAGDILPESKDSLVERYSINEEILSQKMTFNSRFLPYAQTANAAYRKGLFSQIGYFDELISGGDADYSWRMQLETDYIMVYAKDAVVLHKHRTDLKGLFKQRFRHGYGSVLILNKYKDIRNKYEQISARSDLKSHKGRIINSVINHLKQKDYWLLLPTFVNMFGYNLGRIYAKFLLMIYKNQSDIK